MEPSPEGSLAEVAAIEASTESKDEIIKAENEEEKSEILRCYRKVVVVASFPWLCKKSLPPGHMTLLFWDNVACTEAQLQQVKAAVAMFDRPYRRRATPKPGQSFLWAPEEDPCVDPAGPIGQLITAFETIDPKHEHRSSPEDNRLFTTVALLAIFYQHKPKLRGLPRLI